MTEKYTRWLVITNQDDKFTLPYTRLAFNGNIELDKCRAIAFSMFAGWACTKEGAWFVNLSTCWNKANKTNKKSTIERFVKELNLTLLHELVHLAGERGEAYDGPPGQNLLISHSHKKRWEPFLERCL